MRNSLSQFFTTFYGHEFHRYFIRPLPFPKKPGHFEKFKVQTPKQLFNYVHRNSSLHPCFINIYDYGSNSNLNKRNPSTMILDRAFFDFDITNDEAHKIKKQLQDLKSHGLNHQQELQDELREQLQNLIINERMAEPAINQAKEFSNKFKEWSDAYPILFFSGCKGCHVYTFFQPIELVNIKRSLSWFAEENKKKFNSLDLSVYNTLNSRVPYSKHQYSLLTVVPFQIDDSYNTIMEKSLNPIVESFNRGAYFSSFGEYLEQIDPILEYNEKIKEENRRATRAGMDKAYNSSIVDDHRLFFKSILGEPEREYPDKEYVMYKCPFPGHDDNKPSFRVHKTGYYCYGCERKGNYFQFLKDYNKWSNEEVKAHMKENKPMEA